MKKSMLGETRPLASIKRVKRSITEDKTLPLKVVKRKTKLTKKERFIRLSILCAVLLLASGGAIFGIIEYSQYNYNMIQVKAGIQHLRNGESLLSQVSKNPFDAQSTSRAQQEFSLGLSLFQHVDSNLNALPGISTWAPVVGSKVTAAQHLVPLAIETSKMGVIACQTLNMLMPELRNPMGTTGPKLTQADLNAAGQNLQQIQATLRLLLNQVNMLQPNDLQIDPGLAKYVGTLRKDGPVLQDTLDQARSFLSVAPALLGVGTPANYLLEIMDSTELRPGGGFIGNYGTITLTDARVTNIFMTDIDLIDKPFEMAGHFIPYPPLYRWFDLAGSWSFRDSNLDADFPTDARNGEQTYGLEAPYELQGGPAKSLQGVIATTPWFMEGLLKITGPINMQPDYNETVTAQNLVDRIHAHQLGANHGSELIPSPDGHSSQRKRFTSLLADHILARIHQLTSSPSAMSSVFKLITTSLHTKDIQLYFNSSVAENLLQHYQLASAVQSPAGDSLFVADANISRNKASDFITYTMHDQVTIDTSGNAMHHTTLSYAWVLPGQNYGSSTYRDYVHVYVPPGSTLQAQDGWQPRGTDQLFGREVWMGYFTLQFGQTQVITLTWIAPKVATLDKQGWNYQDLLQKQAGDIWNVNVQIVLPKCANNSRLAGGLVDKNSQSAVFSGTLNEDKNFEVTYLCTS